MLSKTLACILLFGALGQATAKAAKPTVKSIGDAVLCQCGCGMTVSSCNHYECASRTEMQAMAQKEIAEGKDETTILQDFVLRYGVKVLATPPATGFNVSVWVLPPVGLIVGLVVVVLIVRRWRKPVEQSSGEAPAPIDPRVLAAVDEEMKKVTG